MKRVVLLKNLFKKKQEKWEYVIRGLNPSDFELELVFFAKNELLLKIFQKTKQRLSKMGKGTVKGDPDLIERFDVEPQYLKLLKTFILKPYKITRDEVESIDKMKLLNYDVVKAWFEKNKELNVWAIFIVVRGQYVKV